MNLQKRTIYRLDGWDFTSLEDAQKHVENEIGKILDATPLRMDPKQALAVFEAIVANKRRLVELLTIEVELDGDEVTQRNLLDLDTDFPHIA